MFVYLTYRKEGDGYKVFINTRDVKVQVNPTMQGALEHRGAIILFFLIQRQDFRILLIVKDNMRAFLWSMSVEYKALEVIN